MTESFDAVVIGGGPAGSVAGTILAQHGHNVCLLEKADSNRFHVGESLIPHTYETLERIGMIEKIQASDFPRKYSVQFVTENGMITKPFYFFKRDPHPRSISWQVWRSDFDRMLLENATEKGCEVRTKAHVTDVMFENDRATGVTYKDGLGNTKTIQCKVVVDASGQSSIIANRFKLRQDNQELRQASIWTYFENVQMDNGVDRGATIILNTQGKHGWFWFIPLPGNRVSIGAVSSKDYLLVPGKSKQEMYEWMLDQCPVLKDRLKNATRVDEFHATRDFSYMCSKGSGNGWVLIGDSYGFLDPVYSSGILLAFKSAELAADAVHEGLVNNDLSENRLGGWEPLHRRAVASFRKLVYAFYSYNFSFGSFIRQHPQYYDNLVDLLVGDVYKDGVDEIFDAMGELQPYDGCPPTHEMNAVNQAERLVEELV